MKRNLIMSAFLLACTLAVGQESYKEKYADKLYAGFEYRQGAPVYAELADKLLKNGKEADELCLKAARGFYHSRQYAQSMKYYGLIKMKAQIFDPSDIRNFYDVLIRFENYEELKAQQELFAENLGQMWEDAAREKLNELKDRNLYKVTVSSFNSGQGDYAPSIIDSAVYFSSNRSDVGFTHNEYGWDGLNYSNLYVLQDAKPVWVKERSTKYHDGPVCGDASGNEYVTRTSMIGGEKHVEVWVYSNGAKDPLPFGLNSESYNIGHVAFSGDYKRLYFASDMPGGMGGSDIYYLDLQSNGKWSSPVNLKSVNTPGDEFFPSLDRDGQLYFASSGRFGLGGLDLFSYDLESGEEAKNLGAPINSNGDDFGMCFSGKKSGWFSSDREGFVDQIYKFDLLVINGILEISALDAKTGKNIDDAEIMLLDRESGDTLKFVAIEGVAKIPVVNNKDYIVLGQKKNYELKAPLYLNTDNLTSNEVIERDLYFDHIRYDIIVKTVVKGTNEPLGNVTGEFVDPLTGETIRFETNDQGFASVNLDNYHDYVARARKKGFLDLEENVTTSSELLIELDLKLEEIKKDLTFEIENIFYDLDKWFLRPESKQELDKLVEFLQVNDNIVVELSSHTDSRGSDSYNKTLSQKRAQSCVDYLIEKGIPTSQISAKGYGETKLVNRCRNGVACSEEEHQANRRTEIKILEVNDF